MNESFSNIRESNPFSTCFIAPGRTPFFFERSFLYRMKSAHPAKFEEFFVRSLGVADDLKNAVCVQFLIDRFEANSRRGQIVGAHGTGKTSLMLVLKDAMQKRGYEVFEWTLHDQCRFLPDVFWLELQRFLQTTPSFLPAKCLLPPPVLSNEEYIKQTRESLRDMLGAENEVADVQLDEDEPVEEFRVGEAFVAPVAGESTVSAAEEAPTRVSEETEELKRETPETPSRPARIKKASRFGFNKAWNFGLKTAGNEDADSKSDGVLSALGEESIKFAPFPGIAPPNETVALEESENVEDGNSTNNEAQVSSAVDAEFDDDVQNQKKLEIPLPSSGDFTANRSLFEKKVLFFDGFEQLSYVNRIIIRTFCRMNRLGLLLTTHTPAIGIPVLFRTHPSAEILRQLLSFLLDDLEATPADSDLEILLKNFNYDVREILFSLYDAYENYRWAPREVREKIVKRYPR